MVARPADVAAPFPDSLLSRLTLGRKALWVVGAGAMCIFLGLLSAPIRMPVPEPPSLEGAGDAAANAAARIMGLANGQARGVQLAGFDAETTSSAIAG